MKRLIKKYQNTPGPIDKPGRWTRVKVANNDKTKAGRYGYIWVDDNNRPWEYNERNGTFKVYLDTPNSGNYYWTNKYEGADYNHNTPAYDYSSKHEKPKNREQIRENQQIDATNQYADTFVNIPDNILREYQLQNLQGSAHRTWYDSTGKPHFEFGEQGMSGTDPLGKFYVEGVALGKPLQLAGRGLLYGTGRWGSGAVQNWSRAKLISGEIDKQVVNGLKYPLGQQVETTLMYTPTKEAYVPTSLKFYERGPARISEAEKTGVPKGERNLQSHGTSQAPYYDYSLINRHQEPWTIENGQFVFAPPWEANKLGTIHFSFNQPVSEHSGGNWMNYPTTVLLPYRNIRSQTPPVDIALMDTFFPNYNGLKISTRGAKVLTGDRKTFDYYRNNGIDVEFSPEIEHELQRLRIYNQKLSNIPDRYKYGRYGQYPSVDRVYEMRREIGENIQKLIDDWTLKNRKPIPSFNKVTELGEAEGLNMKQFPYQLANYSEPYYNLYGDIRQTGMTGLDYTWVTDPTNHATFLQSPEYMLKQINNGESIVRPEYKQYLEWVIKNKADYRE